MNQFILTILLCLSLVWSANASQLTLTDNLILRDVNDKPIEQGFFSNKQQLTLSKGHHTLVLKYKDVFEDTDMSEERLVTSEYFVVSFKITNQQQLVLSTTKINDLAAAERFSQQPELSLLDEQGNEISLHLEKLKDYELAKQVNKVVTSLSLPAKASENMSSVKSKQNDVDNFNDKVISEVDALPMLKYWWTKASQKQKKDFLVFINERK